MNTQSKTIIWLGVVLMMIMGVVHLLDAQSAFDDATYKGWLFVAYGLFAFIAAIGIYRGKQTWGWKFGALVAVSTLLGYIASRTIGLPQLPAEPDAWLEPLGVASVVAEGAFLIVFGLSNRSTAITTPVTL